jgi:formylglycine-generating enzyme required for sulfatase activity
LEDEWMFAAVGRNEEYDRYPWGEPFISTHLRWSGDDEGGGTVPVGLYPHAASDFGVEDLLGNIWEWVTRRERVAPLGRIKRVPVLKGGAWNSSGDELKEDGVHVERSIPASSQERNIGFRIVVVVMETGE